MTEPSAEATTAREAARVAATRGSRPSGWWGMAVLVATEAALFGTFVASYFYLRFQAVEWPPPGTEPPPVLVPFVLTAVLVSTSAPMALAVRFARQGRVRATSHALAVATVIGSGYLAMQVYRFLDDLQTSTPAAGAYESMVYLLSGGHHAHVLAGLLVNLFLLARLAGGLTNYRLVALEAAALYWYFVDALAIVVVLTITSPSL